MPNEIILASNSPRRKELLALLIAVFRVEVSDFDESTVPLTLLPADHVLYSSRMKAMSVAKQFPDAVVIGADTIVVLDDVIMGKPVDLDNAREMLSSLSGRTHQVYTGISVISEGIIKSACECTDVHFSRMTDRTIDRYVASGEPLDKAGAYGIQGYGSALIEKINGCYFNVVGLPVHQLSRILIQLGVSTYLS